MVDGVAQPLFQDLWGGILGQVELEITGGGGGQRAVGVVAEQPLDLERLELG